MTLKFRSVGPVFPSDYPRAELELVAVRIGRAEWLDEHANPTDQPLMAATFGSPYEVVTFLREHTEEPRLWTWEYRLLTVEAVGARTS